MTPINIQFTRFSAYYSPLISTVTGGFLKDEGMDSTALLGNFCFVGSQQSACTQLARQCAFFTRRWLQTPSSPQPYFEALRDGKVVQVIYNVQV